jgi:hypothetical protein
MAGERLFDDELQEGGEPLRAYKYVAREDSNELGLYG